MGVDNYARLVFGIILGKEIFEKIVRKYLPEDYDDDFIFYFQENEDLIEKDYKGIYLGNAYPFYDSDWESWTFYLGIGEDREALSIDEVNNLLSTYQETDFKRFLQDFDIENQEPSLMAISHVN